ncbi:hypothetical protein LPTSP4_18450 [Leptospira ryugenii]|uniref:Uncharacterized protein n=1 Tax=Leptospira ryugenii TaxID=1917863 RepID=A0A2P2E0B7_9LEPT|nr:hypothetical protein [Leptospira ryugenii]GBF50320.1 hypothetical protein LPTSP4_18450 [Leptospira ryugenii]
MERQSPFYPKGQWSSTYPKHLLAMETLFQQRRQSLHPEVSVYLAGLVARRLDSEYWTQVEQTFLVESPEEIYDLIRKHSLYIGQNAPIVTTSRYNAEHLMINIALDQQSYQFLLKIPSKYYGIASTYSYYAGNETLGRILQFLSRHTQQIIDQLRAYMHSIQDRDEIPEPSPILKELWDKFSKGVESKKTKGGFDASVDIAQILQQMRGFN